MIDFDRLWSFWRRLSR